MLIIICMLITMKFDSTFAVMSFLYTFIVALQDTVSGCTSGFMQLDLLRKNAELIKNGRRTTGRLNAEIRIFPSMKFTRSGNITGLLLVADIRWINGRNQYPEIQLWRNHNGTDQFIRQASQEIRLNPGVFSPDGVLQFNLTTPMSFQSGDVLGVYQPSIPVATARLQVHFTSGPDSYRYSTISNNDSTVSIALQNTLRVSDQLLMLSPITDNIGHFGNGFLSPTGLRRIAARLNIHDVVTIEKEQRLFPDITFTCNGSITKWIVGAGDINGREHDYSQVQIWRKSASNEYYRMSATLLIPNETIHSNVHEYFPSPPLEFQEGDILGVYQPNKSENLMKLYYQRYTGPINYARRNIDQPLSWTILSSPTTQLYYPLVSFVVSRLSTSGGLILTSSPTSLLQVNSAISVTNLLSPTSTQTETPTNLDNKVIVLEIFVGLAILVSVAIAIMMAMLSTKSCRHRKKIKTDLTVVQTAADQVQHKNCGHPRAIQIYGNVGKGSETTNASCTPEPVVIQNIAYEIPVTQNSCYTAASCENIAQNSTTDLDQYSYTTIPYSSSSFDMVENSAYGVKDN